MSKALVLGAAALIFSAAGASAQIYMTPDYGYVQPVADLAPPAYGYGYAAPAYVAPGPVYTAPPGYAAPVYSAPPVYVAPPPAYAAPVVSGYYAAPMLSQPTYDYAPGYWGRGYWGRDGYGWR